MALKIVIVGGVAGGAGVVAKARCTDEHAEITLFERGPYVSFANCGLPYYVSEEITDPENLLLQTPESFWKRFRVKVHAFHEVLSIDRSAKKVLVKNLVSGGTRILKFFLHISRDEQKKRLLERLDTPEKRWKYSPQDIKERGHWKAYRKAFEEAISATSTKEAPWFVVPANHKWYRNLVVADHLVRALEDMDPRPPKIHGIDWKKVRRDVLET